MKKFTIMLYAVISYAAFNAVFLYMIGFLFDYVVPKSVNSGTPIPVPAAIAVNIALIALFGITHSVMARPQFKRLLAKFLDPAAERSTFVFQSSAFLAVLMIFWLPVPAVIWTVNGSVAVVFYAAAAAGAATIMISTFLLDHFSFLGLRQAWCHLRGQTMPALQFRTPLFYRWVRHPMQTGVLMIFAATPHMTAGHLLLLTGMALYIAIGLRFEERALLREFGQEYALYRERVPMLLPIPRIGRPSLRGSLQNSWHS